MHPTKVKSFNILINAYFLIHLWWTKKTQGIFAYSRVNRKNVWIYKNVSKFLNCDQHSNNGSAIVYIHNCLAQVYNMIIIVLFIENFIWTFFFLDTQFIRIIFLVKHAEHSSIRSITCKRVLWINTVPHIEAVILLLNPQNQQNSHNSFKRIWYCSFKNMYVMKPQIFLVFWNYF